jgi:hypothetical protein
MPPILKPTFDSPDDWQPVFVGGSSGRWPSWWRDPTGPEPTIDQSGSQSQPTTKEKTE